MSELLKPRSNARNPIITEVMESNSSISSAGRFTSMIVTRHLINHILQTVDLSIEYVQLIKGNLCPFSKQMASIIISENVSMHLNTITQVERISLQQEPSALYTDNLIPIGTQLEYRPSDNVQKQAAQNSDSKQFANPLSRNQSVNSKISRNDNPQNPKKKTYRMDNMLKLDQKQVPDQSKVVDDPFVDELRKRKAQQLSLKMAESQKKKGSGLRDVIKKNENVSYDFSGDILKVKNNLKSNFLGRNFQANENDAFLKQKQISQDSNPTNLEGAKKDFSIKNNSKSKRASDVQFSHISSLTNDLKVVEGVKFLHNKAVLEKKVKDKELREIKKNLTNSRLSKKEFSRLQSLGANRSARSKHQHASLPTIIDSEKAQNQGQTQNRVQFKRSASLSNFSVIQQQGQLSTKNVTIDQRHLNDSLKSQNRTDREKVSIQNEELLQTLLSTAYNNMNDAHRLKKVTQESKGQGHGSGELNFIDKANLNFVKTGSVGRLELPKISYRINNEEKLKLKLHSKGKGYAKSKNKGINKDNHFQSQKNLFEQKLRI